MTRSCIAAIFATAAAILLGALLVNAQQNSAALSTANLAVEILNHDRPGSQFPVLGPPDGGFMEMGPTRRLPDWKQPEGTQPLARIRVRALTEGDAVRIKVFAVFDDSEPVDSPGPKYGAKEKPVASYLAKKGETISVRELRSFGVEPLLLKIVNARPQPEEQPLALQPMVISRLNSVEVIATGADPSSTPSFLVSLRNISSKNITALEIHETEEGRRTGRSETMMESRADHPMIAAGATSETEIDAGLSSCRVTPQGCIPEPPTQLTFEVGTAVFDDGTYEGDAEVAAGIEARRVGRRIQLGRIVSLLKDKLDAPGEVEATTLEKLKEEVSCLRIDVDPRIINEVLGRYPSLTGEGQKKRVMREVMEGLTGVREEVLNRLKGFERSGGRGPGGDNLKTWLSRMKEEYEATSSSI